MRYTDRVRNGAILGMALLTAFAVAPPDATGQAYFFDASVHQAYAAEPLPTPMGFSVAVGRTGIVGPLGLHAGVRSLFERGAHDLAQVCGFATCTDGPFNQSYSMRMIWAGISYDFPNPVDVYLNLGFNAGLNRQTEHLTHVDTGSEIEDRTDSALSLGGSVDLRLRPLLGPLRPSFSARYDRIYASDCAADVSCFPDRDVWSISVGFSLVSRVR